jgi:hypothetical protein
MPQENTSEVVKAAGENLNAIPQADTGAEINLDEPVDGLHETLLAINATGAGKRTVGSHLGAIQQGCDFIDKMFDM